MWSNMTKQPRRKLLRVVADGVVATALFLLIKAEKAVQLLRNKEERSQGKDT
jgi:hypothetical protein